MNTFISKICQNIMFKDTEVLFDEKTPHCVTLSYLINIICHGQTA